MNGPRTMAVTRRLLRQVRGDHRTMGLVFGVPAILLIVMRYVFDGQPQVFERIAPALIGIFPLVSMFLVTSIAMLRERTGGTLERLMASPIGRGELLTGYGLAFALLALGQTAITAAVAFWGLDVDVTGSVAAVMAIAVANALLGMAIGLLLSAFARSEFQAVQFMPAAILPQIFLCGLFVPRDQMAPLLEWISWAMPLSYAFDALQHSAQESSMTGDFAIDVGVVCASVVLAIAGGALTLRRRTP